MIRFATIGSGHIVEQFLTEAKKASPNSPSPPSIPVPGACRRIRRPVGKPPHLHRPKPAVRLPRGRAVYIASPNLCHTEQAMTLISRQAHPVRKAHGHHLHRLRRHGAAGAQYVILLEGMRTLFAPGFARLHQLIPEIGTLRRITAGYCQYSSRYDSYLSGGRPNAFDPRLNNAAVADLGVCIAPTIAWPDEPQRSSPAAISWVSSRGPGRAMAQYPSFLADWR